MSYDLYLEVDAGGPEPVEPDGFYWNYTSNVAGMWRLAMPRTDGLAGMHGMRASDAAEELRRGVSYMERHPEPFRAMDPENGWGCFDGENGQLGMLKYLLKWCERVPAARVRVSR